MPALDKSAGLTEAIARIGDGARVMIAPMAQMFLFGTEIDYKTSLLSSEFVFNNPNVAEACGCGESIKFKDIEELSAEHENGAPRL